MSAEDRVLTLIRDQGGPQTTQMVAAQLHLSRSVTSHYLNRLADQGLLVKNDERPVQWRLATNETAEQQTDGFRQFVGATGSLRDIIDQCTAAVHYPPNGLNILITGDSGVGKSFLAQQIYEYARANKVIEADAPYIVLNCADYANNPELLSSILFGYVRGAYTGAETDHDGLLAQADGGYLFLDEVHRLSSENQEKLFTFMDTSRFFRMGENQQSRHATVRLIFATTEDPEQVMLGTFRRRIAVTVHLPNFSARPVDERLTLLTALFHQEAKVLQRPVVVTGAVLSILVHCRHQGNIGYLKNWIRRGCASGFKDQAKQPVIRLTAHDFGLTGKNTLDNWTDITIEPTAAVQQQTTDTLDQAWQHFTTAVAEMKAPADWEHQSLMTQLQTMVPSVPAWEAAHPLHGPHAYWFHSILQQQFGLAVDATLESLIFALYRRRMVLPAAQRADWGAAIRHHYPRAAHVAAAFYQHLEALTPASQESLQACLTLLLHDYVDETIQLKGMMIAHGERTATSIQAVVNQLCGTYVFDAIDMPINTGVAAVIEKAQRSIDALDTSEGFILLVDMGSLSQLYTALRPHLDGDLMVVNNLTTVTALDLALKMKQHLPFKEIAEAAEQYTIETQYYTGFSQSPNILISCISGLGISEKISEIMKQYVPAPIKVLPVDYAQMKRKLTDAEQANYFDQTLFVLTTNDLSANSSVPFLNIYDLLEQEGTKQLTDWLRPYVEPGRLQQLNEELLRFFSIEGVSERLSFLNPDIVIKEVEGVITKYEAAYHMTLDGKVKLNLYMHVALMLERLLVRRNVAVPAVHPSPAEAEFIQLSRGIFRPLELKYNIRVDDYELSLMFEVYKPYMTV